MSCFDKVHWPPSSVSVNVKISPKSETDAKTTRTARQWERIPHWITICNSKSQWMNRWVPEAAKNYSWTFVSISTTTSIALCLSFDDMSAMFCLLSTSIVGLEYEQPLLRWEGPWIAIGVTISWDNNVKNNHNCLKEQKHVFSTNHRCFLQRSR